MDPLVESYLKSPHEEDRKRAIGALCRASDRESVIALQQMAEIDESLEIRFYARKAMAMIKNMRRGKTDESLLMLIPEKLDVETFQLFSDEEKCALLKALIAQNRSDTLVCLVSVLKTEQNPHVLSSLVIAIGTFGTVAECRFLIPCLAHRDARVRANTIEALELIGNLKLFAYIFPLLEDPDNRVRANAARSLKSIEPFTSFRLLQAMVTSGKIAFQASAIYVLRCFESDASAALVAPFLDSPHDDLRQRAEQTLRLLAEKGITRACEVVDNMAAPAANSEPEPDPESVLEELTGHPDPVQEIFYRLKQAFVIADPRQRLEEIEKESVQLGERAVEPLIEFLAQESEPMVVGKIYILLGRLYDLRAIPCLVAGLAQPDNRCRANAVEALGMLSDPESLRSLIPHLADYNNRVRGNAILALRALDGVDIKDSIVSLAEHSEEFYQRTAVYVLAELQRPEYFPILQRLTRAQFPVVRKNANTAISALARAGFNVTGQNDEDAGTVTAKAEAEFADQIIGMIGGPSDSRLRSANVKRTAKTLPFAHKEAAGGWSRLKIAGVTVALVFMLTGIGVAINLLMQHNTEQIAKDAAVEQAMVGAKSAMQKGGGVADKIPALLAEAEKIMSDIDQGSAQAVVAHKKLARMRNAVQTAKILAQDLKKSFAGLISVNEVVEAHCQKLIKTVNAVKQAPSGQTYPYSGHVDAEKIKTELATLVSTRKELDQSASFIDRLPVALVRAREDMPSVTEIKAEQKNFKKLDDVLPVFSSPVAAMSALEGDIISATLFIEKAEIEIVQANPRHEMLAEFSALKSSLFAGRDQLAGCRKKMAQKQKETVELVESGNVAELIANLNVVTKDLDIASKSAGLLPEMPVMLERAFGSMIRVMATLHQKAFAEKVSLGMEADFSTNWEKVTAKERTQLVKLYADVHPNGQVVAADLAAFARLDIADIYDELQAVSVLINKSSYDLVKAGMFLDTLAVQAP